MMKSYPEEFRRSAVRIAHQDQLTYAQVAGDFAVTQICLGNWVGKADIDDGTRPGTTVA